MFTVAAWKTFDQFWTIPQLKSVSVYLYFWVVLFAEHSLCYVTEYQLASGTLLLLNHPTSFKLEVWTSVLTFSCKNVLIVSWIHCSFNDPHASLGHHETRQYFSFGRIGFLCVVLRIYLQSLRLEENRCVSVCLYLTGRSSVQPTLTISSS